MQRHRQPPRRPTLTWWACWCLLIALPVYGFSTVVTALLGPAHFHATTITASNVAVPTPSDPMAGWQDLRRVNHVSDAAVRVHDHSALGRHHHAAGDVGVVTVGVGDQEEGADTGAASASTTLVFAISHDEPAPKTAGRITDAGWNPPRDCAFASSEPRLTERPPKA